VLALAAGTARRCVGEHGFEGDREGRAVDVASAHCASAAERDAEWIESVNDTLKGDR